MPEGRACVSCGADVDDGRSRVCAACLLAIAAGPESSEYPTMTAIVGLGPGEGTHARLKNGQIFGGYRIERLLGRGGMGEVYEAEQLESGRRLALKVVSERLADSADRSRFLREGQLAASVNHPNCVYVFGAEEIEGSPVISMELLAGGTLKDRVENEGPLPPAEAVDAILQVISGLDAAHQAGVLHRDVKPSNCFVDAEGTVKIGDFGLSISTLARRPGGFTESGVIRGTPQFAAPEQLKGEPLDVRADIYAAGATLYYLLTGGAPFESDTLTGLIARVLSEEAPSARAAQPDVPSALDRILARCLAKDPAHRPPDYATLYRELRTVQHPRHLRPRRSMCGLPPARSIMSSCFRSRLRVGAQRGSLEAQAAGFLAWVLYFSNPRRPLGGLHRQAAVRTPRRQGNRVWPCRSRSSRDTCRRLHGRRHASVLALLLPDRGGPADGIAGAFLASGFLSCLLLAVLFSSARRGNGFASLYDLFTATRVVSRGARHSLDLVDATMDVAARPVSDVRVFGPYRVLGELPAASTGRLLVASDDALQRRVWIHWAAGTTAVSVIRRGLTRHCRLRWLAGGRMGGDDWDAFEAPAGAPLRDVAAAPQPWRVVRRWLCDLGRELELGVADGTLKSLSVDRVWITRRGVPIVLDWDVAQPTTSELAPDREGAQQFLQQVAVRSLNGRPGGEDVPVAPLPLDARRTLQRLEDAAFESFAAIRAAFEDLMDRADAVSRRRRAASIVFPGLVFVAIVVVTLIAGWFGALAGSTDLPHWIDERAALERRGHVGDPRRAEALDVYLAGIFGTDLRGAAFWNSPRGRARRTLRPSIERMLDTHRVVTSRELGRAIEVLQPELDRRAQGGRFAVNVTDFTWMFMCKPSPSPLSLGSPRS